MNSYVHYVTYQSTMEQFLHEQVGMYEAIHRMLEQQDYAHLHSYIVVQANGIQQRRKGNEFREQTNRETWSVNCGFDFAYLFVANLSTSNMSAL